MTERIKKAEEAVGAASGELHEAVKEAFPTGTKVKIRIGRGEFEYSVTGYPDDHIGGLILYREGKTITRNYLNVELVK